MINYIFLIFCLIICGCATLTPSGQSFLFAQGNSMNYVSENCDKVYNGQTATDCDAMVVALNKWEQDANSENQNGTFWVSEN